MICTKWASNKTLHLFSTNLIPLYASTKESKYSVLDIASSSTIIIIQFKLKSYTRKCLLTRLWLLPGLSLGLALPGVCGAGKILTWASIATMRSNFPQTGKTIRDVRLTHGPWRLPTRQPQRWRFPPIRWTNTLPGETHSLRLPHRKAHLGKRGRGFYLGSL